MQKAVDQEEQKAEELIAEIDDLQNNPLKIEREARATLGYVKDGEYLIRFDISDFDQ